MTPEREAEIRSATDDRKEPSHHFLLRATRDLLARVTQLTNERDGEREARERCSDALRAKDAAMGALMSICTQEQIERAAGGPLP